MNKAITIIVGLAIGVLAVGWLNTHPGAFALNPEGAFAAATSPSATTEQQTQTSVLPEGQPWIENTPENPIPKVRGVKMPGNCLHLVPEMVTYVEQHPEVSDKDIPDYVCGWN